jgi:hypothetical protein
MEPTDAERGRLEAAWAARGVVGEDAPVAPHRRLISDRYAAIEQYRFIFTMGG